MLRPQVSLMQIPGMGVYIPHFQGRGDCTNNHPSPLFKKQIKLQSIRYVNKKWLSPVREVGHVREYPYPLSWKWARLLFIAFFLGGGGGEKQGRSPPPLSDFLGLAENTSHEKNPAYAVRHCYVHVRARSSPLFESDLRHSLCLYPTVSGRIVCWSPDSRWISHSSGRRAWAQIQGGGGGGVGTGGHVPPPPHDFEDGGHNIKCPPPPHEFCITQGPSSSEKSYIYGKSYQHFISNILQ